MRKAQYSLKQVKLPNASTCGFSLRVAKPGYWVVMDDGDSRHQVGRVLGRIDRTDSDGEDCAGYLAVMALSITMRHSYVRWIDPITVTECYEAVPSHLLAWITGPEWVKSADDIARLLAMADHGTTSEHYIATRDDPANPYNVPGAGRQFILNRKG